MNPPTFNKLKPKIVLGIAAHPDDLDFGAAGTMASFAQQGAEVHYLILTDGSRGTDNPNLTSQELVTIRETEQRAAVQAVGGTDVQFLGYPDGELEITMQLKKDIVKVIRTIRPDVVITMDPGMLYSANRGFINHPDHRAAGQAALDAVFPLSRDHLTFPELFEQGYLPHKTTTVLLVNFESGNFYVDITDTLQTKLAALAAHSSQISDMATTASFMTSMAQASSEQSGYELSESFIRIDVQ